MQRTQFGNNIKSLCNSKHLDFKRDYDHIYISTDYETFCFELDDQNVWLSYRELRGIGEEGKEKLNQFLNNPKPGKVIETVLQNITVNTEEEYVAMHYKRIKELCDKYGMRCEMKFNKIFIYNMAEEFYIQFDIYSTNRITLMHKGYKGCAGDGVMSGKTSYEYHKQLNKQMSSCEIVEYIRNHTKSKYGVI